MDRLFGIETEYGFSVEGLGAGDLMREAAALVRCAPQPAFTGWNYRGEDPRRDLRGFTVDRLSTNPDDAQFDTPGSAPVSIAEERCDHVLGNGARLYNDHGHPEYATPECRVLRDLVAHDRAGERIVLECARKRATAAGRDIRVYKNNTDYHGASYGTHESYLSLRETPPESLIRSMLPFLATRPILVGAGKVGTEGELRSKPIFQLSQRADFITCEASVDTLHKRPLFNTRDEPHAAPTRYRRIHVIAGDANLCEWSTAMKIGTTALALALAEDGFCPNLRLKCPVKAARSVSRDMTLDWSVPLEDGRATTALALQRVYQEEAARRFAGSSEDADWTLAEWERALDDLEHDWKLLADRADWAAKRLLIEEFLESEGFGWGDPFVQSLDLAYHDLDPDAGLFAGLEQAGRVRRLVTEARIAAAVTCPPSDTRAAIRGIFVRRFGAAIRSVGWNGVVFTHGGEDYLFDMNPLVERNVRPVAESLEAAPDLAGAAEVLAWVKSSEPPPPG